MTQNATKGKERLFAEIACCKNICRSSAPKMAGEEAEAPVQETKEPAEGEAANEDSKTSPGGRKKIMWGQVFLGQVVDWKGKYGWILPAEMIRHAKASMRQGRIFVSRTDLGEAKPEKPVFCSHSTGWHLVNSLAIPASKGGIRKTNHGVMEFLYFFIQLDSIKLELQLFTQLDHDSPIVLVLSFVSYLLS
eukprot:s359_g16.t1